MLSTKTDKKLLNILLKTASKSMLQLGSILEPTWLHFGRVLGVKMWPSWLQLALKIDPKNDTKNDHLLYRLKIDFWWILGPNLVPKRGKHYSDFGAFFDLGALLGPRCPLNSSKRPLGSDFTDFGLQLGSF